MGFVIFARKWFHAVDRSQKSFHQRIARIDARCGGPTANFVCKHNGCAWKPEFIAVQFLQYVQCQSADIDFFARTTCAR